MVPCAERNPKTRAGTARIVDDLGREAEWSLLAGNPAKRKPLFPRAPTKEAALYLRSAIMPIFSEVAPYDFHP